jgi:hypothetical protein
MTILDGNRKKRHVNKWMYGYFLVRIQITYALAPKYNFATHFALPVVVGAFAFGQIKKNVCQQSADRR